MTRRRLHHTDSGVSMIPGMPRSLGAAAYRPAVIEATAEAINRVIGALRPVK